MIRRNCATGEKESGKERKERVSQSREGGANDTASEDYELEDGEGGESPSPSTNVAASGDEWGRVA